MTEKTNGKKQPLASGSIGRAFNRLARIDGDADSQQMSTARSLSLSNANKHDVPCTSYQPIPVVLRAQQSETTDNPPVSRQGESITLH